MSTKTRLVSRIHIPGMYHGCWLFCDNRMLICVRLLSPNLPTARNLRRVVEQYFANIHPLKCFAFVHKPSFMRQLDKGFTTDDESALLHVVCAHGAK